jgi:hypothetical protein
VIDAFAEENIAQQIGGAGGHKAESIRDSVIRNSVAIARVAVDGDDAPAATRARCVLVVAAAVVVIINNF